MAVVTNFINAMENIRGTFRIGGYFAAVRMVSMAPMTLDRHSDRHLVKNYRESQMSDSDHGIIIIKNN